MIRAKRKWKQVLQTSQAPLVDTAKDAALQDFIARSKAPRDDAWY
jgi:trimethylamine--corrinoid protein Co-methyltransferase